MYYKTGISKEVSALVGSIVNLVVKGEKKVEPNPFYPEESYEQFISRMIIEKKKKIERVLELN